MKKGLFTLLALLVLSSVCYAQTPVNFVYIHGSDQGPAQDFQVWMDRMHPDMKKNLSNNAFFKEKVLKDAYIKDTAQMEYWADKTFAGREQVTEGLNLAEKFSAFLTQGARTFIAHMLHDIVWLEKYSNMKAITDDINKTVIQNSRNGEKTVLVGYSAGALITYQYLLDKSKYIVPISFMKKYQKEMNLSDKYISYASKYATEPTCIDALVDSGVVFVNGDGGFITNPNEEQRMDGMKNLKEQTKLSCMPDNSMIGVINLGSPLLVFHTDIANTNSQARLFAEKLYQNIVESGEFVLTVNYTKDPMAIPIENMSFKEMQKSAPDIKNGGGFVYHTMVKGGVTFIVAHLKYWDTTNSYTKKVAKSFEEGYKFFYGIDE